ncbi:pyridoxal phosphate-dependent aminotransferase [Microvirga guangxiensis]|uniref:8-amino-7-oxononanoate synthase n=1 Tax=Microvirga guangxiensis TaxID=549386 RepID=A0A1G5KXV0_9HYPH|nr:pyridoxal phosphate-dependent aminotransferase [Microvirga guangxiensis]SCZ04958.1 Aspartate/methionine/tyrosine aminotransferase [Microvirga guangxiensis]
MNASVSIPSTFSLRPEAEQAPTSGIVDVFSYGRDKPGIIPLWVGEGDLPTPAFISDAAARSLKDGETFYTYQRGIPELRQAIARYHENVYRKPFDSERFFVTSGGMPAMQLAFRMLCGNGDEVLIPTPAWPNFAGAITISGARPVAVPMNIDKRGWHLDFERLEKSITPRTRVVVLNSPSNPTGWTASHDDLRAVLDMARRHGLWIVADEIYSRFVHDPALTDEGRAPSFRDVMEPEDRILFIQTFSKNWAMTGWRLGWLEAPTELGQVIENLVQYQTSGTPTFIQRAGVAALEQGEEFLATQIAKAKRGREIVGQLAETGLVELPPPSGAFYAFLKIKGATSSKDIAFRLIDEANVGLAPGNAFGDAGEGYLRLCYLRKEQDLEEAVQRIGAALPKLVA